LSLPPRSSARSAQGGTISCLPDFFGRIGDADYLRRKTDLTTEIEAVRYSTDS
jgi:hypothetical protein